jgi:hypothetical protein
MRRYLTLAVCALLLGGCGPGDPGMGLQQARFIEVVVELRRAALASTDTAAFEIRKQQILAEAGVSEAELRAYVESHAGDFNHMAAVWDSINSRVSEADPH